jgi:hypothetical protein
MSYKFFVGEGVEYTPIGEKTAGLYKIIRQMPDEDGATDLRYRIKSESEAHERVVPESLLTSGVVAEAEYALARGRILNCIVDQVLKGKD